VCRPRGALARRWRFTPKLLPLLLPAVVVTETLSLPDLALAGAL